MASGEKEDLRDVGLAVILLRSMPEPRWNQAELARRSSVDPGLISDYELGRKKPGRRTKQKLVAPVEVSTAFFDHLVDVSRSIRRAYQRARGAGDAGGPAPDLERVVAGAVQEGMAPYLLQLSQRNRGTGPRAADRAWAEERWARMAPLAAAAQSHLIDVLRGDERSWALAEKLCLLSAAPGPAAEARRLARLAARLLSHCPGSAPWRRRGVPG